MEELHETRNSSGRPKGGAAMTAQEITNAFKMMAAKLQQVQTALPAEQVTTADLPEHALWRSLGKHWGHQDRPGERRLAEDAPQRATVPQLQVVSQRHEEQPIEEARQILEGAHRAL